MPRNEIAAIIGLIVVLFYVLAGPGRGRNLMRTPQGIATLVMVFVVAFALTWIGLRLIDY
jgi:hypothetical protein